MNLHPALEPLRQFLLKNPPLEVDGDDIKKTPVFKQDSSFDNTVAVLRLDYEVDWNNDIRPNWTDVVPLLIGQINGDVTYLIENGDREHTTDPLLKSLDGMKKHGGLEPTMVEFFDITAVSEDVPKKKSTEYTVWLKVRVRWL